MSLVVIENNALGEIVILIDVDTLREGEIAAEGNFALLGVRDLLGDEEDEELGESDNVKLWDNEGVILGKDEGVIL